MADRLKVGDLVTIDLGEFRNVSNTYRIHRKLETESVLSHPLTPDCFIIRLDAELGNSFPTMQSSLEKCMFFARKHRDLLGYVMECDLEAMCYFFSIRKELSPKQRHDLSNICGKIASVILNNSLTTAGMTIRENRVLLDEHQQVIHNTIKKFVDQPTTIKDKKDRYALFNMAGFILAQLAPSGGHSEQG